MKKLVVFFLALAPAVSFADVVCNQVGTMTICTDTITGRTITCNQVGTMTVCS